MIHPSNNHWNNDMDDGIAREASRITHQKCNRRIAELEADVERLRELLREVINSGVSFEDERVGYKEMQLSVALLDEIKQLINTPAAPGEEEL